MNQYKTDLLDLRCMDCMDLLRDTPDNHYSLCIVDPPYGIGAGKASFINGASKSANKYTKDSNWDVKPSKEYFLELCRVSKNQIIFGANHLGMFEPSSAWVVWDKTIHGNSYADGELAWTSFKSPLRIYRCNMVQTTLDGRIHPTQKPVKLYKWLLHNYAKPGDKILDTHLGSCSIAIACHYAGYHLTGCELDEDYFKAGVERVKRETAQRDMFTEGLI
jgi:site-specific DNA-methyltransferase (adenine-specific)